MQRLGRGQLVALSLLTLITAACGGSVNSTTDAADAAGAPPSEVTEGAGAPATADTDDHATDESEPKNADRETANHKSDDDYTVAERESSGADRTVEVEMSEFAFTPEHVTVEAGRTVRFLFTNTGEVTHEAVLGDMHVQQEHEEAMAEGTNDHGGAESGGHHGDIPSVTVEPGETGEFVHTFTEVEDLILGCHLPGHWDAGMHATLDVEG